MGRLGEVIANCQLTDTAWRYAYQLNENVCSCAEGFVCIIHIEVSAHSRTGFDFYQGSSISCSTRECRS